MMTGKVALITGASSGIGRATGLVFAGRGASVVLASRRKDELLDAVAEIERAGGAATAIRADVSVAADVESAVAHAIATYGRLDYLVNNAGTEGAVGPVTELDEAAWMRAIDVNLKGAFLCTRYAARAMLAGGDGGAIVHVGSVNSFLGFRMGTSYSASKHGLIGLVSSASAELAPQGIRVNLLCPGVVDTPMHHRARALVGDALFDEVLIPKVHLGRVGQPEEIARASAFLCSDEASFITGTTLTPDGGGTLTI